jgi:hypothetical protein
MATSYSQLVSDADAFEEAEDFEAARKIWRRLIGLAPVTSTSKDGLTVTFSEAMISRKLALLDSLIARAAGHGKVRHIPFEKVRVDATPTTVYDSDGYAWGY